MRDGKTAGGRHKVYTNMFDGHGDVEEQLDELVAAGCTILSAQHIRSPEYTHRSLWTIVYREPAERRPATSLPSQLSTVSRNLAGALMARLATALRHRMP